MDVEFVTELSRDAVMIAMLLGAPIFIVAMVVGVFISTLQAATQINEMTLTFIPKLVAIGTVLWLFGPWMLEHWLAYTTDLWHGLTTVGAGH